MELSEDFTQIEMGDDQVVTIYSLIPLYPEELEFKKQNGTVALLERFDHFGIDEIVKIGRPNVCV
ncbi:Suppressor of fused protein (SUFU) [compost metagenome]